MRATLMKASFSSNQMTDDSSSSSASAAAAVKSKGTGTKRGADELDKESSKKKKKARGESVRVSGSVFLSSYSQKDHDEDMAEEPVAEQKTDIDVKHGLQKSQTSFVLSCFG